MKGQITHIKEFQKHLQIGKDVLILLQLKLKKKKNWQHEQFFLVSRTILESERGGVGPFERGPSGLTLKNLSDLARGRELCKIMTTTSSAEI